jgi:hypothetical protein
MVGGGRDEESRMRLQTIAQAQTMPLDQARELIIQDFTNNLHPPVAVLMWVVAEIVKRKGEHPEAVFNAIRAEGFARGGKRSMFDQPAGFNGRLQ